MRPFRFAIISDPHITLPHTLRDIPNRFHLVEVSIPAFEHILAVLAAEPLDFLLMPGDLTQHGERDNHTWLIQRLQQLPFPTYVVPGNHDVITAAGCDRTLSLGEFPRWYADFGYGHSPHPYYCQEILPGLRLIGLNSIAFDDSGTQLPYGYIDPAQLDWLEHTLAQWAGDQILVMVHHNGLDHLPGQGRHPLGRRYSIKNRRQLLHRLHQAQVPFLFTGHLHVQDVVQKQRLWEITTGSLVSYPHPYRVVTATPTPTGGLTLNVTSDRVQAIPDWPDLQGASLEWMGDRAFSFLVRLLMGPPFNLPQAEAEQYAPQIEDFWATIAGGDGNFTYPHLPPALQQQIKTFGAVDANGTYQPIDNTAVLTS